MKIAKSLSLLSLALGLGGAAAAGTMAPVRGRGPALLRVPGQARSEKWIGRAGKPGTWQRKRRRDLRRGGR